jgi:hypothetical protein
MGLSEPVGAAVRPRQRPTTSAATSLAIPPTIYSTTAYSSVPLVRRQNRPRKSSKFLILLGIVSANLVVFLVWLGAVTVSNHEDVVENTLLNNVPPNSLPKRRPQQRQPAPLTRIPGTISVNKPFAGILWWCRREALTIIGPEGLCRKVPHVAAMVNLYL